MEASAEAIDDDWVSVSVEDLPDENCSIENLYMKRIRGEFCAPFSSLWYRRAASHWTEALPLGNGRLGAMLFGGTATETVELNEDSLWSGGPKDWNNPGAKDVLPAVREAVFAGHFAKATELSKDMLGAYAQVYEPLGTLSLLFSNPPSEEKVQEYVRQLDLDTAVASVAYTWSSENGGKAGILREAFVSQLDQVLAIRITTDYEEGVSLSVRLDSPLKQSVHVNDRGNQVVLIGRCRGDSPMGGNFIEREGKEGTGGKEATKKGVQEGVAFAAVIEVQLWNGGRVMEGQDAKSLDIVSAGGVLILVAGASSYEGPHVAPKDSSRDPLAMCEAAIGAAAEKNWEELLACHLADYQPLFRKMDLEFLGPKEEERAAIGKLDGQEEITVRSKEDIASDFCQIRAGQSPALETPSILNTHKTTSHSAVSRSNSSKQSGVTDAIISAISKGGVLPTDERLKSFQETRDPSLVTLLFQYGRYLLLSSSRPGSFVANLQGIWSQGLNPPWRGCPHLNINLEMNYWPAEVCNLVDSHRPLFELVKILAENGTLTAEVNYGLPGWVCHHQTDIWGQTGTTADDPSWALWPMGGAWLVLHLWEHYCFSPNQDFLRETAYPLLRGSALFLLNWLVEDPHSGNLLTCPSTSPEHLFLQEDGQVASVAMGATMDLSIINHVFSACIVANEILGDQDGDICTELKRARDRLLPLQVGKNGCLMEWHSCRHRQRNCCCSR